MSHATIEDFRAAKIEWDMPEMSYAEYKVLRAEEYASTHATDLTEDEAEAAVALTIEQGNNVPTVNNPNPTLTESTEIMSTDTDTDTNTTVSPEQAKKDAKNARRRELRAAAKAAATTPAAKPAKPAKATKVTPAAAKTDTGPSKKDQAVAIYKAVMKAKGERKDGIARLTGELALSPAGASTYWQNCKSGRWS